MYNRQSFLVNWAHTCGMRAFSRSDESVLVVVLADVVRRDDVAGKFFWSPANIVGAREREGVVVSAECIVDVECRIGVTFNIG